MAMLAIGLLGAWLGPSSRSTSHVLSAAVDANSPTSPSHICIAGKSATIVYILGVQKAATTNISEGMKQRGFAPAGAGAMCDALNGSFSPDTDNLCSKELHIFDCPIEAKHVPGSSCYMSTAEHLALYPKDPCQNIVTSNRRFWK